MKGKPPMSEFPSESSSLPYEAVLRRPSRAWIVCIAVLVCLTVAWLGACGVECARFARDASIAKSCASADATFVNGACEVPQIHIQLRAHDAKAERNPFTGPGGS